MGSTSMFAWAGPTGGLRAKRVYRVARAQLKNEVSWELGLAQLAYAMSPS